MADLWKALTRMADSRATRGSAMQPVLITDMMMGLILLAAISIQAPHWILVSVLVAELVSVGVTLGMFCIFMFYKPDVIRSENYHLRRLEIEQGAIGDNVLGLIESGQLKVPLLPQNPKNGAPHG